MNDKTIIIGIDLAWGSKNPLKQDTKKDGVCVVETNTKKYNILEFAYTSGDNSLLDLISRYKSNYSRTLIMIDAPIVCINKTGMRPVDKLTHRLFHKEHAACHPANSTKCSRPIRIAKRLKKLGIEIDWNLNKSPHIAIEVYPHPAMVRLFHLERIFKYKKGKISDKNKEFKKYQNTFHNFLEKHFKNLKLTQETIELFNVEWSKQAEDKLDALFCATIGMWHYRYYGSKSEILGNKRSGFILLPKF